MHQALIGPEADDQGRYLVAERFVDWLEQRVLKEARGDEAHESIYDPTGIYWLGRLGPKDSVPAASERGDRLEPCAIGLRIRPRENGPWKFTVNVRFCMWRRRRLPKKEVDDGLIWAYDKTPFVAVSLPVVVAGGSEVEIFGGSDFSTELSKLGAHSLSAEIRVRITGRSEDQRALEITVVNTSQEDKEFCDSRFFEASLSVEEMDWRYFDLESLPDSFRFDRKVPAYGVNCGVLVVDKTIQTSDGPAATKHRPDFWAAWKGMDERPSMDFLDLANDASASADLLVSAFEEWVSSEWSADKIASRAEIDCWSQGMRHEADDAKREVNTELERVRNGASLLRSNPTLRRSFQLMNRAMHKSAHGKYTGWRPFQFAFILANLECLVSTEAESETVDIVWFATGGGKTETYLGLLLTAAFMDRLRGKVSGVTAWSRFPLRLLSVQQTQRFANALASAEIVRREEAIQGDSFSLGFLVGSTGTPNRIKKESPRDNEDADKISERNNPFKLLDECPFCRRRGVVTSFDRAVWRLVHACRNPSCPSEGKPLPVYVIDDEVWRFLPTVIVGTLDKAANIARQNSSGMRGMFGSPLGLCSKHGHGYAYAKRKDFPNGCLVPDCRADIGGLPMDRELYPLSFRLQDELHLLRDSLGAVDAHYECIIDGIQEHLSTKRPKILASSATLAGYRKQVDVLYRRKARVFPQLPPRDGKGFWSSDSDSLMRRYVALAPRRLTVEFVVGKLIVSLQNAISLLVDNPALVCNEIRVDSCYADFLINLYGTNVVYGNTLQDIDAIVRSSETQYAELKNPLNVASLTGRVKNLEEVREILDRLEAPEKEFRSRLHLVAASSMMSHGVDIDRLNVMIMLAFPLGVAEFIQATARVGRRWPALVIVVPKMTRERDASVYRAFPEFVRHGDRFVEPIPITRKSRRVLERTMPGLELARINMIHEPSAPHSLTSIRAFNAFLSENPELLQLDQQAIADSLGLGPEDEFMRQQMASWFEGFSRGLREPPGDSAFVSQLCPSMTSLRDVEEQAPIKGDSTK